MGVVCIERLCGVVLRERLFENLKKIVGDL